MKVSFSKKNSPTVYLATDHAGFELKEKIKEALIRDGYEVKDFGAAKYDAEDDYPDFISKAAETISQDPGNRAIIFGGSGQGEAIVANKFPGVRAAVYYGNAEEMPKLTRQHNDSNILSLGARFLTPDDAIAAVKVFLETPFSEEQRHIRRIEKIKKIEETI
ncbi:RpiB/LacA/LacB family sugar-phosphate isomerase [Candidatus Daviesbacteria bacterium]|nr:RpiB/LacA/LacB family sugar-phosphate isomerase [Candidatus Daviesbacteria bacterium]